MFNPDLLVKTKKTSIYCVSQIRDEATVRRKLVFKVIQQVVELVLLLVQVRLNLYCSPDKGSRLSHRLNTRLWRLPPFPLRHQNSEVRMSGFGSSARTGHSAMSHRRQSSQFGVFSGSTSDDTSLMTRTISARRDAVSSSGSM